MSILQRLCLLALPLAVAAVDKDAELGAGITSDSADGRGGYGDIAVTVADKHKLSFNHQGYRSTFSYRSPCTNRYALDLILRGNTRHPWRDALLVFPEQELENISRDDSWSYRYLGAQWGGGISGSHYDGGDGLESQELSLNGYWQGANWDLGVDASHSENELNLATQRYNGQINNPQCLTTRTAHQFNRRGVGITIGYTTDSGLRVYMSSIDYDSDFEFPANLSYETLLLRTVNAGSLSTVLTQRRVNAGVQFSIADWMMSLETGREQSMIDESETRFTTLWLIVPLSKTWELEFNAGNTQLDLGDEADSDDADNLRTLGAGLRLYW